jgi:hypothetical protein
MRLIGAAAATGLLLLSPVLFSTAMAQSAPPPTRATASQTMPTMTGMFATVASSDGLSSQIVGLSVYNNANEDIGTIKDIAYSGNEVKAYILSIGGVLGVGGRDVAVDPAHLNVAYDPTAKKWHANMNATTDQLKSAPVFTYPAKS